MKQTIETQERGAVELSSDLEKYFALKTKALLKLGFNKSQIGLAPLLSLSGKNDYRKDLKINSLK